MKNWLKDNWWKAILLIGVFAAVGPGLINWAFKQSAPFEILHAEWKVDTALTFYGGIVASLIAVCGVFLTIQYTQKNYQEDARNRVLPIFSINTLHTRIRANWDVNRTEDDSVASGLAEAYTEYEIRDYYYTVKNGIIDWRTGWTREQKELLRNGGVVAPKSTPGLKMQSVGYFCLPIVCTSVGNGPALNVRCGFNLKSIKEEKRRFSYPIPAAKGDIITAHIFFEDATEGSRDLGEYVFALAYQDILGNKYYQSIDIKLEYKTTTEQVVCVTSADEQQFVGSKDVEWIREDGKNKSTHS